MPGTSKQHVLRCLSLALLMGTASAPWTAGCRREPETPAVDGESPPDRADEAAPEDPEPTEAAGPDPSDASRPAGPIQDRSVVRFFGVPAGEDARKVVYLVDASGSMTDGFGFVKLEIARSIRRLRTEHQFDVIFFGQGLPAELPEERLVDATEANKQGALEFVDSVHPRGNTEPEAAIRRAFALRPEVIYLLSDGDLPASVVDVFAELNADRRVIVHTILAGVYDGHILVQVARENGGKFTFISESDLTSLGF